MWGASPLMDDMWMDFVADQLADGRRFRSLTVVDMYYAGNILSQRVECGASLESLANPHAKRVAVSALGQIGAKIDVIFLAQFEPQTTAAAGQEVATLHLL